MILLRKKEQLKLLVPDVRATVKEATVHAVVRATSSLVATRSHPQRVVSPSAAPHYCHPLANQPRVDDSGRAESADCQGGSWLLAHLRGNYKHVLTERSCYYYPLLPFLTLPALLRLIISHIPNPP